MTQSTTLAAPPRPQRYAANAAAITPVAFVPPLLEAGVTECYDIPTTQGGVTRVLQLALKVDMGKNHEPLSHRLWQIYYAKEHPPMHTLFTLREITRDMFNDEGYLGRKFARHCLYAIFGQDDKHPFFVVTYHNTLQLPDGGGPVKDSSPLFRALQSYVNVHILDMVDIWNDLQPHLKDSWAVAHVKESRRRKLAKNDEDVHWRER